MRLFLLDPAGRVPGGRGQPAVRPPSQGAGDPDCLPEQVQDGGRQPASSGETGAGGESQCEEGAAGTEDGGGELPVPAGETGESEAAS